MHVVDHCRGARAAPQSFGPGRSEVILSSGHFLLVVGAPALSQQIAAGAELAGRRVDLATVRAAAESRSNKLIELTPDQWQFLRGVYAMNLEAPPGLPYGDEAVLTIGGGESDGLLFFVDGDKTCTPVNAPPALLSLVDQFAGGDIDHRRAGATAAISRPSSRPDG